MQHLLLVCSLSIFPSPPPSNYLSFLLPHYLSIYSPSFVLFETLSGMRQVGMRNWKLNLSAIVQLNLKISAFNTNLANSNNTILIDLLRSWRVYTDKKTPRAPWQSYFGYMFWLKFKHINEEEEEVAKAQKKTWQYNTAEAHTNTPLTHTSHLHSHSRLVFVAFRIKLPTFFVVCRFSFIFSCASFLLLPSLLPAPQCCVYCCMCVCVCVKFFYNKSFPPFCFPSLSLFLSVLLVAVACFISKQDFISNNVNFRHPYEACLILI